MTKAFMTQKDFFTVKKKTKHPPTHHWPLANGWLFRNITENTVRVGNLL